MWSSWKAYNEKLDRTTIQICVSTNGSVTGSDGDRDCEQGQEPIHYFFQFTCLEIINEARSLNDSRLNRL